MQSGCVAFAGFRRVSTSSPIAGAVPSSAFSVLAFVAACTAIVQPAEAQSASSATTPLPPVVVEDQAEKQKTRKVAKKKPSGAAQASQQPAPKQGEAPAETAKGPVNGYVAKQTATGTKTDTAIAKVPQSISVVPRDQIEDQKAGSVAEALRYTPGVFTDYRGASNLKDEMFVRGFYYVPRYLDGLYLAGDASYAKIDPYLLERIELLSGPSSVLYGQGNPGGIVNMVSKRPTDEPYHEVQLTFGNMDQIGLAFDFSDRVAGSKELSYRIAGTGFDRDLQEDFTKQRTFAIAPSLTWKPDKDTKLTLLGGYQNDPEMGYRNFLEAAGTLLPIAGYGYIPRSFNVSDPSFEKSEREQYWAGYEFEHAFTDALTVRQNLRYHHVDHLQNLLVEWAISGTSIARRARGGPESWDTFGVDNQVQAKVETGIARHTILAGLDYLHRDRDFQWNGNNANLWIDLTNPQYGVGAIPLTTPLNDETTTAAQTGLYVQDQIDIGRFTVTAGLRHDWASTEIDDKLGTNDQSYDDKSFTWRAGAVYTFDNGIAPYASYSTSFDPSLYLPPAGASAFDPTTAEQYEFGVKYAPKGTNTLLTAAYYDLTQQGVVMGEWNGSQTVYRQIGEIHNKGVELSARAELTRNLSVIASYSHINSKVADSVTAAEIGKTPTRIPEDQAALWGKYTFSTGLIRGAAIGAGVRYVGASWGNNTNTLEVPSVTLFDAMVSYDFAALNPKWDGIDLQVNVKNLTDESFVASCNSPYACWYGEGRLVTGTLSYKW